MNLAVLLRGLRSEPACEGSLFPVDEGDAEQFVRGLAPWQDWSLKQLPTE